MEEALHRLLRRLEEEIGDSAVLPSIAPELRVLREMGIHPSVLAVVDEEESDEACEG